MTETPQEKRRRIAAWTVQQLMDEQGFDGYTATALVWQVHRNLEHPMRAEVAAAGHRAMLRHHGHDDAVMTLRAAASRAGRSMSQFAAALAATYAEMDDEFRQHPDVRQVSDELDRWYEP